MASHPDTLVDCSKVFVKKSTFSNEETGDFAGAFAAADLKEGDLVERGVMRRMPDGFDGMNCQWCFTWSDNVPNHTWATGSGCAPFYNTDKAGHANTRMTRDFDKDTFEIFATREIKEGEELMHTYKSLKWRTCFKPLDDVIEKNYAAKN